MTLIGIPYPPKRIQVFTSLPRQHPAEPLKTVLLDTAILYSLHLIVMSMFGQAGKRGTLEPHQNQLETHGHTVWHFIKLEV